MHILEMKLHCSSFFPQTNVLIICKDFLALDTPRATLKLWYITSHLWNRIRKQSVELLVGAVANPTPTRRVKVLPDASQANSHPLAEQGVGVWQLLQAVRYQIALQTGLLEGRGAMQNEWWVYEMQRCEAFGYKGGAPADEYIWWIWERLTEPWELKQHHWITLIWIRRETLDCGS